LVDTQGNIWSCIITAANASDSKTALDVLTPVLKINPKLTKVLADQGYRGDLAETLKNTYQCTLELTQNLGTEFIVQPWRWIVERTFAWLENARRLCRDYEQLPQHHCAFVFMAMIWLN